MLYVFDTSSFIVLGHYFPQRFPSFWEKFDAAVSNGQVISVREVLRELENYGNRDHLEVWIARNKRIFLKSTPEEAIFVAEIFKVPHFRQNVSEKQRLKGTPVADPFVIAAAHYHDGTVITEEVLKPNAARIPNICAHFGIAWTNLEGFLSECGWAF
jgi:hypothetical protein